LPKLYKVLLLPEIYEELPLPEEFRCSSRNEEESSKGGSDMVEEAKFR